MIHNISIATDDDIIQFGNDVNIYTVYLSRAIIIWGNCLNWLEKTIVSDHIFCQILVSWFGYLLMATECTYTQIRMCVQLDAASVFLVTVKLVLSGQSKIDKN